jgi:hypothetical protein
LAGRSPVGGRDNADLAKYAQAVFDADPQKNVIFDQHIYGNWGLDAQKQSWQQGLRRRKVPAVSPSRCKKRTPRPSKCCR